MEALLVVDVQCGMFGDAAVRPFEGEAVVERIVGMIGRAREKGVKVIFAQHAGDEGDVLAAGSAGFLLRPALGVREGC